MNAPLLLGLDVGGSGPRCVLASADGATRIASSRTDVPAGRGADASEYVLEDVWQAVVNAVREVLAGAGARPDDVAGIAATGVRFSTIVVDAAGAPLLAATNRDARAAGDAFGLAEQHGEALFAISGHWPSPLLGVARLRRLGAQGDALARAHVVASLSDWIAYRLCDVWATDPSQAASTGLIDLATRSWSDAWIDRLDLPRSAFAPLRDAGEALGPLTAAAAQALGLRAGIPVAVGGGDTQCALLGAGATQAGERVAVCGTTLPVQQVCAAPPLGGGGHLFQEPHAVPGRWVVESNGGAAGAALDWLGTVLAPQSPQPGATVLGHAAASLPGARGVMARVGGEPISGRDLDLPLAALHFSTAIDDPHAARSDWSRAAAESVAYGLRANLERLDAEGFPSGAPLRLAGGLTGSSFWNQLVAGVVGAPVEVSSTPDASALGAAICAGVGAGVFDDLATGALALAEGRPTFRPAEGTSERYAALYARWVDHGRAAEPARPHARQHAIEALLAGAAVDGAHRAAPRERPRILVTADMDPASLAALERHGDVEYAPFRKMGRLLTGPSLIEALAGVRVFVTEIDVVDAAAMAALPELRVVASCRGDAVNVDVAAATLHGIPVLNAPGRNAEAVADLALGFMLALLRKLPGANAFLRDPSVEAGDMGKMGQAFGAFRGRELAGKTVGLVGLGAVGRAVARRLQGFDCHVLVHDPFLEDARVWQLGLEPTSFDGLLERADAVSLHAAVTDESRGLMDAAAFARMRPGAVLLNTARAALVDEDALLDALATGTLGGVALDVFDVEPPGAEHPLLAFDNVIATPHVGGNTEEIGRHQGRIIAADLARLFAGAAPEHVLDAAVLAAFDWNAPRPVPSAEALAALADAPGPAVTDLQRDKQKRAKPKRAKKQPRMDTAANAAPADAERTAAMTRILEAFAARLSADDALGAFANDRDVTLFFELTDLPIAFRLGLTGRVDAGLAALPDDPEVVLRMRAAILDGMFTGTVNPMQEAMNGGLSFSGDAAKAMTIQHIQADLERCYRAARAEAGGDVQRVVDSLSARMSS